MQKHLLSKIYKLTSLKLESRVRVILILWFYVIVGVAILAIFTHDLTNASKNVIIVKYFLCESKGTLPNSNESRCTHLEQSVQEVFNPISSAVAIIIFIGLVPSVNLVYVFKFTELKSMLRKCFQKHTRNTVNSYYPNISHDPECKSAALHRNLLT